MADLFLHLEVDAYGVNAKIIEPGHKQTLIREECRVLYLNLSEKENSDNRFAPAIEALSEKINLGACSTAIIFVSDSFVSFRHLELPFKSHKKIRQVLGFELEPLLPMQDEAYISDFITTGDSDQSSSIIFSASIERSIVDELFRILEPYGIRPSLITPTGYAAALCFSKVHSGRLDFIVLHLSENRATIVMFKAGTPFTVRTFPTRALSSKKLAQNIIQTITGHEHKTGSDYTFDFYLCLDDPDMETGPVYSAIEQVCGPHLNLAGETEHIDTESYICSISPDKIPSGLFNFCKGEFRSSTFFQANLVSIAVTAGLLVFALALMLGGVLMENTQLSRRVYAVDQEALQIFKQTFPGIKTVRDPYMEMKANVGSELKKSKSALGPGAEAGDPDIKVVNLIAEISNQVDARLDMEISRFLFSNGRLVLSGSTDNFNNVDKIKSRLEASSYFKKVDISSAASDKKENRVNFKFIVEL